MEEKIFFKSGEIVTLRQNIPNAPTMYVVDIVKGVFRPDMVKGLKKPEDSFLKGIRCRWFTTDGTLQEAVYNTKDLVKIEE